MTKKDCSHPASDDPKREKRVLSLMSKWSKILGLTSWEIKLYFVDDLGTDEASGGQKLAEIVNLYPYHRASLGVCREMYDHIDKEEEEGMVIHELLHILQAPLAATLDDCVPAKNKGEVGVKIEEITDWFMVILQRGGW